MRNAEEVGAASARSMPVVPCCAQVQAACKAQLCRLPATPCSPGHQPAVNRGRFEHKVGPQKPAVTSDYTNQVYGNRGVAVLPRAQQHFARVIRTLQLECGGRVALGCRAHCSGRGLQPRHSCHGPWSLVWAAWEVWRNEMPRRGAPWLQHPAVTPCRQPLPLPPGWCAVILLPPATQDLIHQVTWPPSTIAPYAVCLYWCAPRAGSGQRSKASSLPHQAFSARRRRASSRGGSSSSRRHHDQHHLLQERGAECQNCDGEGEPWLRGRGWAVWSSAEAAPDD